VEAIRDCDGLLRGSNETLSLRGGGRFSPRVLVSICEEESVFFDIPTVVLRIRATRVGNGRPSKGTLEQERALPLEVSGSDQARDQRRSPGSSR
jgi:hypothetical protein